MSIKDELKKLSDSIRQNRDEIRVQLHLARADVKDEWDDLDAEWKRFLNKVEAVSRDAQDVSDEARETTRKLGHDLKEGYERIRDRLK